MVNYLLLFLNWYKYLQPLSIVQGRPTNGNQHILRQWQTTQHSSPTTRGGWQKKIADLVTASEHVTTSLYNLPLIIYK